MPRLSPALIRQATSENPLLTQLLRVCRDLPSARNELRWLQEHARDAVNAKRYASHAPAAPPHGDTGVDTPKETGRLSTQTVPLDYAELEDSHIPTKSKKQNAGVSQYLHGQVRRVDTGSLIRQHPAHVATDKDLGMKIQPKRNLVERVSNNVNSNDQKPPGFRLRYQNRDSEPTEGNPLDLTRANASKATQGTSNPVKVRSPEGTRKVNLGQKTGRISRSDSQFQKILTENIEKRSLGMPLQYIIGNQPFGTLDILCRRGVLIPRPETEMYTAKVANLLLSALNHADLKVSPISQRRKKFRILDLCTGTGCIALLLHSILKSVDAAMPKLHPGLDIEILGVDLNPKAINLARKNLDLNVRRKLLHPDATNTVSFQRMDVLALARKADEGETLEYEIRRILNAAAAGVPGEDLSQYNLSAPWDMVIANPPYVAPKDYALGGKTEPSVRDYEPKEALVPVASGRFLSSAVILADLFYQPLIRIARAVDAKLLVMEVGGSSQALRVGKQIVLNKGSEVSSRSSNNPQAFSSEAGAQLEAWRDDEAVRALPMETPAAFEEAFERGIDAKISDRAVVAWSGQMADWRRRNFSELHRKEDQSVFPGPASEGVKVDLKRAKDEARAARRTMRLEILAKRLREAAGTEVTWKASEKRVL